MSSKLSGLTKAKLQSYVKDGMTDEAIGAMYEGASRQAVFQLRKKFKIKSNRTRLKARNAEIRKKYKEYCPVADIAAEYDLSLSQTYRIVEKTRRPKI